MYKLRILLLFIGIFGGSYLLVAQDLQYSQFFANQLDLNPAFAGSQYYHRLIVNYRNQWPEVGRPYISYAVSYDRHQAAINSGFGIQIKQDRQGKGALVTTTFSGIYSYLVKLRPHAGLRFAVGVSVIQNSADLSNLEFPDMIDPIFGSVYPHQTGDDPSNLNKLSVDFSTGFLFFAGNYTVGGSVQHLGEPSLAFSADAHLPMKYTLHAGAEFAIHHRGLRESRYSINPLFMFQKQASHHQMNYGGFINWSNLTGGAWFRQNFDRPLNAMIFMLGYDNRIFRVAYSFDWGLSRLARVGSGAHEVSLIFLMGERIRKKRYKEIPCPKFFRKNEMNYLNGF
ncbi:PorP/SprF family type IX secretion system membrane protein [Culturomica massiliensis]|uniref:PorP/SprF family type IX secretion system membrane protein n=1 Tax=Culturomica massiliensis TaxID=1841857 RepID=UPI0008389D3B|nr:PorP/SprF family type IX secretion system membrane protein [Culturomica massiliensis]